MATAMTVCVTGAGGFVGSWLVQRLLAAGRYTVHGTVRDPGNFSRYAAAQRFQPWINIIEQQFLLSIYRVLLVLVNEHGRAIELAHVTAGDRFSIDLCAGDAKNAHLAALDGAGERLRLFRADLLDCGSLAAAVAGCDGVFHVACPVPDYPIADPEAPHHATPFSLISSASCAISIDFDFSSSDTGHPCRRCVAAGRAARSSRDGHHERPQGVLPGAGQEGRRGLVPLRRDGEP